MKILFLSCACLHPLLGLEYHWSQKRTLFESGIVQSDLADGYAIGMKKDGYDLLVQVASMKEGEAPVTLSRCKAYGETDYCWHPQIVASDQGVTAVWTHRDENGVSSIYGAFKGSEWSEPVCISPQNGTNYLDPHLVVDGAGNFTAVWRCVRFFGTDEVLCATKRVGESWEAPIQLLYGKGAHHSVAMNAKGNAIVARSTHNPLDFVYPATIEAVIQSTGWSSPYVISKPFSVFGASDILAFPQVAINNQGDAVVLWNGCRGLTVALKPFEKEWDPSVSVSWWSGNWPKVLIDPEGTIYVVWKEWSGILGFTHTVKMISKEHGQEWGDPVALSDPFTWQFTGTTLEMDCDKEGNVVVAWGKHGEQSTAIQVATKSKGSDWSIVDIAATDGYAGTIRLAMGVDRSVAVSWLTSAGAMEYVKGVPSF